MLKSQRAANVALAALLDSFTLVVAFVVAWFLRDHLGSALLWFGDVFHLSLRNLVLHKRELTLTQRILFSGNPLVGFKSHLWVLYLAIPSWLYCLHAQHGYEPDAQRNARQELAICAYAGMTGTVALMVFMFMAKAHSISRLLILGFLITGVIALWIERIALVPLLNLRRRPLRNVLIIGRRSAAMRFVDIFQQPSYRWNRIVGYITDDPEAESGAVAAGPAYLGDLASLSAVLDSQVVDEVVLVRSNNMLLLDDSHGAVWRDLLHLCLQRGRSVSLVDEIEPPFGAKIEAVMMGPLPALVLHNTPQNPGALAIKHVLDRCIAFITLIMLAPLLGIIAIAIKLTSPGPVLFNQDRVGLNGRLFRFYKFRSMVIDAEDILERKRGEWEQHNKMSGGFFKLDDDPRVTKIGRFLRRYSCDELPQLWNVLRGEMSLVGPRPPLPKEVEQLKPWQLRKLSVKGGLTCLWQVSGRNDIDTEEWMRLDLEYIDNWSLWLDCKLVLKTVKVLLRPRGAS